MASGLLALGREKNPVRKPYRKVLLPLFHLVTYNLNLTGGETRPLLGWCRRRSGSGVGAEVSDEEVHAIGRGPRAFLFCYLFLVSCTPLRAFSISSASLTRAVPSWDVSCGFLRMAAASEK